MDALTDSNAVSVAVTVSAQRMGGRSAQQRNLACNLRRIRENLISLVAAGFVARMAIDGIPRGLL